MPFSTRMKWPFPREGQDPWFDAFEGFVQVLDNSGFASREDRHITLQQGGLISFDGDTGVLSWAANIEIVAAITGFRWEIATGSIVLSEGEMFYVDIPRAPTKNTVVVAKKSNQVPSTDQALFIAMRRDDRIYFRDGFILEDDVSSRILSSRLHTMHVVPSPTTVLGQTPILIGHARVPKGPRDIRVMIGSQDPLDTATMLIKREADASVIATFGGSAGALAEETQLAVSFPATEQYFFTLVSDNVLGTAICSGIEVV